jgi:hypothetical protein
MSDLSFFLQPGSLVSDLLPRRNKRVATINATGGTVTRVGDYKMHTFTASGTFTILSAAPGSNIEYFILGGGAAGSSRRRRGWRRRLYFSWYILYFYSWFFWRSYRCWRSRY